MKTGSRTRPPSSAPSNGNGNGHGQHPSGPEAESQAPALQRGLAVLELLAARDEGATLSEISTALHLSPAVAIAVWALAGGGMGLMYPRLTVLTLAYSTPQNQGFNSSALSIFDAVGSTMAIAVMGLAFTALGGADIAYPVVFAIAALLALLALVPGLRLGHAQEAAP